MKYIRHLPTVIVLGYLSLLSGREMKLAQDYIQCVAEGRPEQTYTLAEGDVMALTSGTIDAVSETRITLTTNLATGASNSSETTSIAPEERLVRGTPLCTSSWDWPVLFGSMGESAGHFGDITFQTKYATVLPKPGQRYLKVDIYCNERRK